MKTIIELPYLTAGLNGDKGLIREHYRAAKKTKEKLIYEVRSQTSNKHKGRVSVVYTRFYCGQSMDWDNAAASFKHIGDALVMAGVIEDDKPDIIISFTPIQTRVKTRKEVKTIIEIIDK